MRSLPPPVMLSTRIPFQGTYGSIWEHAVDREAEQTLEYFDEDPWAFQRVFPALPGRFSADAAQAGEELFEATDYSAIWQDLAEAYADEFAAWLADSLGVDVLAFELEEMTSPKFYNFETDRLFGKFSLTTFQAIRDRLDPDTLADTFRQLFTSRDGFSSFYDNAVPSKPLEEWDHNELFALLTAWAEHTLDGRRSVDDELWDYSIGGLYEEVGRIFDRHVDWAQFRQAVRDKIWADLSETEREELEVYAPRCPATLDLPLTL